MKTAKLFFCVILSIVYFVLFGCSSKSNTTEPKKPNPTMSIQIPSTTNGVNRDIGFTLNTANIPNGFEVSITIGCTTDAVAVNQKAGILRINGVTHTINRATGQVFTAGGLSGNVNAVIRMDVVSTVTMSIAYQSLTATKTLTFFNNALHVTVSPVNTAGYVYSMKIGVIPFDSIPGTASIFTGDVKKIEHIVSYYTENPLDPGITTETFTQNHTNPVSVTSTTPMVLAIKKSGNVRISTKVTLDDDSVVESETPKIIFVIGTQAPSSYMDLKNQAGATVDGSIGTQHQIIQEYSLDQIKTLDIDGYITTIEYKVDCAYNTSFNKDWTTIYASQLGNTQTPKMVIENIPEPSEATGELVVNIRFTDNDNLTTVRTKTLTVEKNRPPEITIDTYSTPITYNDLTSMSARVINMPALVTFNDIKWHITYSNINTATQTHVIDNDALSLSLNMKALWDVRVKIVATTSRNETVTSNEVTIVSNMPTIPDPVITIREKNLDYTRDITAVKATGSNDVYLYDNNIIEKFRLEYDAKPLTGFEGELLIDYRLELIAGNDTLFTNQQIDFTSWDGLTIGYHERNMGTTVNNAGRLIAIIKAQNHHGVEQTINTFETNAYFYGYFLPYTSIEVISSPGYGSVFSTSEIKLGITSDTRGRNYAPLTTAVWHCTPVTHFPGAAVDTTVDLAVDPTGAVTFTDKKPGAYEVYVTTTDASGTSNDSSKHTYIVSNTAPAVSIVSIEQTPLIDKQNEVRVRVIFTATDIDPDDAIGSTQRQKSVLYKHGTSTMIDEQHFAQYNPTDPNFADHYYVDFTATNTSLSTPLGVYAQIIVNDQITIDTNASTSSNQLLFGLTGQNTSSIDIPVRINIAPTLTNITFTATESAVDKTHKVVGNKSVTFNPDTTPNIYMILANMSVSVTATDADGDATTFRVGFENSQGTFYPGSYASFDPEIASGEQLTIERIQERIYQVLGGSAFDASTITHVTFEVRDVHGEYTRYRYPVIIKPSFAQYRGLTQPTTMALQRTHKGVTLTAQRQYTGDYNGGQYSLLPLHGDFDIAYAYYNTSSTSTYCKDDNIFTYYMRKKGASDYVVLADNSSPSITTPSANYALVTSIYDTLHSAGQTLAHTDIAEGKMILKNDFFNWLGCTVEHTFDVSFVQPPTLELLGLYSANRDPAQKSYQLLQQYDAPVGDDIVFDSLTPSRVPMTPAILYQNAYAGNYLQVSISINNSPGMFNSARYFLTYKVYYGASATPAFENSSSVECGMSSTAGFIVTDLIMEEDCRVEYTIYDSTTFTEITGSATVNVIPYVYRYTIESILYGSSSSYYAFTDLQDASSAPVMPANGFNYLCQMNIQTENMTELAGKYWVETFITYDQYGDKSPGNVRAGSWSLRTNTDTPTTWVIDHTTFPISSMQYMVVEYNLQAATGKVVTRRSIHPINLY